MAVTKQVQINGTIHSPGELGQTATRHDTRIVVLIPAYNEERAIASVVRQTKEVMDGFYRPYSILVVDDGSKDATRKILENLEVDRFFHRVNQGKGGVIRNALEFLDPEEIVVTMDGDGEHDPADLPRLLAPVLEDNADLVIGSRFMAGDRSTGYLARIKGGKFFKRFGNRVFSILLWIFTRRAISDTQSGFRAFRGRVARVLGMSAEGFRIEMEMTIKAIQKNIRIQEVPIESKTSTRGSHVKSINDGAKILLTIFRESLPRSIKRCADWILPRLPKSLGNFVN